MPSLNKTILHLEDHSTLIIEDDVFIGSGTYICLRNKSTLHFKGKNYIGHDNKIISSHSTEIGINTSTSWNVTLMEDDGHNLYDINGRIIKKQYRPMKLGDNVGIQMNVTIPRGVNIGPNSLLGANTVIRRNIPNDTLIYTDNILRTKHGFSAGLQFIN